MKGSGIDTGWGVIVDQYLCTNYPDIYAAGDIAETVDRVSGRRFINANYPNAVAQGRTAALNLLGYQIAYEGSDSMNSLKHIGLPVMAGGIMEGDELRRHSEGVLRKLWIKDGKLVGFRLAGDLSGAGIYLSLMRRAVNIDPLKHRLLDPKFGLAYLTDAAFDPTLNIARVE